MQVKAMSELHETAQRYVEAINKAESEGNYKSLVENHLLLEHFVISALDKEEKLTPDFLSYRKKHRELQNNPDYESTLKEVKKELEEVQSDLEMISNSALFVRFYDHGKHMCSAWSEQLIPGIQKSRYAVVDLDCHIEDDDSISLNLSSTNPDLENLAKKYDKKIAKAQSDPKIINKFLELYDNA